MEGFKKFLLRGNLVELAVAFVIGASFAAVVKSFSDVILATVAHVLGGNPDFSSWYIFKDVDPSTGDVTGVPIGIFLTNLIAFLILATVVYFFVVLPYEKAKEVFEKKAEEGEEEPTAEVVLLTQIRDSLTTKD